MSISMADAIRAQVAGLDAGQKQFLANHLWKHYRVAPQKLRQYIPEELYTPEVIFEKGQLVKVILADRECNNAPVGHIGVIVDVDRDDSDLPYLIDWNGPEGAEWFKFEQVARFTPIK